MNEQARMIPDDVIDTLLHVIDYYRENAFVMDGSLRDIELESAELWLKSLPSMPPPSVPLEVQRAIDSCLDTLQTYHSGNPFLSDPVTPEMEIVREWLDNLPQPPQPVYSHRNGETEPPEMEGFYFVVARYGVNVVRLAKGALTQCGDARRYQVPIRAEVAYYGPIPEPQQENNAE